MGRSLREGAVGQEQFVLKLCHGAFELSWVELIELVGQSLLEFFWD